MSRERSYGRRHRDRAIYVDPKKAEELKTRPLRQSDVAMPQTALSLRKVRFYAVHFLRERGRKPTAFACCIFVVTAVRLLPPLLFAAELLVSPLS